MQRLDLSRRMLEDIYKVKSFDAQKVESDINQGRISEKEKFLAAKQILFGLAILYVITMVAYLIRPNDGRKLIDIMTIIFPPLATLILAAYFKDKPN